MSGQSGADRKLGWRASQCSGRQIIRSVSVSCQLPCRADGCYLVGRGMLLILKEVVADLLLSSRCGRFGTRSDRVRADGKAQIRGGQRGLSAALSYAVNSCRSLHLVQHITWPPTDADIPPKLLPSPVLSILFSVEYTLSIQVCHQIRVLRLRTQRYVLMHHHVQVICVPMSGFLKPRTKHKLTFIC